MFLDHTQRRSTVGRTPLDEWSARRRDLYLTTHDTHNRQTSMPPVGFEPKISAGERPQAACLLRSWVRIPPGAWIFVCCECRVLSGRGLCDELITRPEESYQMCCVVVCDLETSGPLACWDRGFESHRGHGYLSVVSVVCCQVEVSATSWSLVQRSPTECAVSLCVI